MTDAGSAPARHLCRRGAGGTAVRWQVTAGSLSNRVAEGRPSHGCEAGKQKAYRRLRLTQSNAEYGLKRSKLPISNIMMNDNSSFPYSSSRWSRPWQDCVASGASYSMIVTESPHCW